MLQQVSKPPVGGSVAAGQTAALLLALRARLQSVMQPPPSRSLFTVAEMICMKASKGINSSLAQIVSVHRDGFSTFRVDEDTFDLGASRWYF